MTTETEIDIDKLLVQISMTGALYGLADCVSEVCAHLKDKPRLVGAALLADAVGKISTKKYDAALVLLDQIINNSQLEKWHADAYGFKALAYQFKGDHYRALQARQRATPEFIHALGAA